MGTLTQQEREALDDIFLTIHSNRLISKEISLFVSLLLDRAKVGIKKTNLAGFVSFFIKKKKSLNKGDILGAFFESQKRKRPVIILTNAKISKSLLNFIKKEVDGSVTVKLIKDLSNF